MSTIEVKKGQEWKSMTGRGHVYRVAGINDGVAVLERESMRGNGDWGNGFPVTLEVVQRGYRLVKEAP